ncbi:MAG: radical SAM protein [Sedimentisphaerales bacterium]|nr:radical SAM protein [Sedimentisphaerales bacterium]
MRILLLQPDHVPQGIGFRLLALSEPLHLEMLASQVPEHDVRILDLRLDADLQSTLRSFQPELVAVTALTPEVYAARETLRQIKTFSPEIFTVVGGHHASLLPGDFMIPSVDAVAVGEAELMFRQLVQAVDAHQGLEQVPNIFRRDADGQFVPHPRLSTKVALDTLPLPRRDLTEAYRDRYFFLLDEVDASVATGRGCPYRCNFCSVWQFYQGRINQMSAERVVREIASIPTNHITFVDDNFLMNHSRERAIAQRLQAEGIRKRYAMQCRTDSIVRHPDLVSLWVDTGLHAALLGLEGASERMLKKVNKTNTLSTNDRAIQILHDHGVIIWGAFIVDPDWAEEDFDLLRDYVHEKEITHTQFTVLTPLPGTQLYQQRYTELLTHDYSCYDTLHSVLPTRLDRERFYQKFAQLYQQTNWGPYFDLLREGKISMAECKRGKAILETMANWKLYLHNDPVLGGRTTRSALAEAHSKPAARTTYSSKGLNP